MYIFVGSNSGTGVSVQNVLNYGADPTGAAASDTAIQNAINWTSSPNRGTIYFPPGQYRVTSPLTFNGASINDELSIRFLGEGQSSYIYGSFAGYIFDRHSASPNNTKGIRGFEGLSISNTTDFGGCVRIGSTDGGYFRNCLFGGFVNVTTEDAAGVSSENISFNCCIFAGNGSGTLGGSNVIIGGAGVSTGCDSRNNDVGWQVYGKGFCFYGGRQEVSNVGFLLGVDSAGTDQGASGFYIGSVGCEGNVTQVYFKGSCSGFTIASIGLLGHDSSNAGIPRGVSNTKYGIRIDADKAKYGVISGATPNNINDTAGISIANATSKTNLVLVGVNSSVIGGAGWVLPTNAQTVKLVSCNQSLVWTYSALPTGSDRVEGDEYDVSDINSGWGTTYTGGGSTRGAVRFNGTAWTVIA